MHASSPREHTARPERRAWPPRPAAGGLLPLLREADFRRYWTAATVSILGDQVSDVAVPLTAVLLLRAAASDVSHLSALEWLPSLLLGLHAGAWADRVGRRRAIMVAADLGRFGLLASVPAAALGVLTLPQLYLVMFAVGALSVLFAVSDAGFFAALVPADRYVAGQSLASGWRSAAEQAGPGLGGLLVQVLGGPLVIAADATSFLCSALLLGRIREARPTPPPPGPVRVLDGLRYIRGEPVLRAALGVTSSVNFFNTMFTALSIFFLVRVLHLGPGLIGLAVAVAATGALAMLATRLRTYRVPA